MSLHRKGYERTSTFHESPRKERQKFAMRQQPRFSSLEPLFGAPPTVRVVPAASGTGFQAHNSKFEFSPTMARTANKVNAGQHALHWARKATVVREEGRKCVLNQTVAVVLHEDRVIPGGKGISRLCVPKKLSRTWLRNRDTNQYASRPLSSSQANGERATFRATVASFAERVF